MEGGFQRWWKKSLGDLNLSRLKFYRKIKVEHGIEKYLDMTDTRMRRLISKLRCSNHSLEIEKGRHKGGKTRTEDRICTFCNNGEVEDEEHFLFKCDTYTPLRDKHLLETITATSDLFTEEFMNNLGNYLIEAFKMRDDLAKATGEGEGGSGMV